MRHTSKYLIVPQEQRRFHNTYRKNTYVHTHTEGVGVFTCLSTAAFPHDLRGNEFTLPK